MINKSIRTSLFFFLMMALFVNQANAKEISFFDSALNWTYSNIIIVLAGLVVMGVIATVLNLLSQLIKKQKDDIYEKAGIIEEVKPTKPFWTRLNELAWKLKPISEEHEILDDHDFDGIRELDNKLPPWWVYLFYLTIVWAAVYFYMFQYSDTAKTQEEIYYVEMEEAKIAKKLYASKQANLVNEYNVVSLTDEKSLANGKGVFITNCAACHGKEGGGLIGPNLTDPYWIHGGSTKDIFKTIKNGVPEKGMIAWKTQMSPSTIHELTSYIESIQGTSPPNPKKKEGKLYKAEAETEQN